MTLGVKSPAKVLYIALKSDYIESESEQEGTNKKVSAIFYRSIMKTHSDASVRNVEVHNQLKNKTMTLGTYKNLLGVYFRLFESLEEKMDEMKGDPLIARLCEHDILGILTRCEQVKEEFKACGVENALEFSRGISSDGIKAFEENISSITEAKDLLPYVYSIFTSLLFGGPSLKGYVDKLRGGKWNNAGKNQFYSLPMEKMKSVLSSSSIEKSLETDREITKAYLFYFKGVFDTLSLTSKDKESLEGKAGKVFMEFVTCLNEVNTEKESVCKKTQSFASEWFNTRSIAFLSVGILSSVVASRYI